MLFGVCLRYAKNHQEAEDFLQEGLIIIFRDLYQYQPTGNFGGWLRKVMINVCLQHLRRKKKIFISDNLDGLTNNLETEENLFSRFRAKALVKMVQQLSPGYRMVFNLFVIEGYSHQEISNLLDISVGTSKSQLSRAKALLRKMLEKEMVDDI